MTISGKARLLALLGFSLALLLPSLVFAQTGATDGLRGGSGGSMTSIDSGLAPGVGGHVPGMPAAASGDAASAGGEETGHKGGKIGKITKVDRDAEDKPEFDRDKVDSSSIYSGIIPGIRDWHYFAARANQAAAKNPKKKNRLSWIGFQALTNGSRVFLQTIKVARYDVDEKTDDEGRILIEITLIGTKVPVYNNRRTLDTSYFSSAVIGAKARSVGRNTVVTITLQSNVPYKVSQQGEFLYVDFDDFGTTPFAQDE